MMSTGRRRSSESGSNRITNSKSACLSLRDIFAYRFRYNVNTRMMSIVKMLNFESGSA